MVRYGLARWRLFGRGVGSVVSLKVGSVVCGPVMWERGWTGGIGEDVDPVWLCCDFEAGSAGTWTGIG